MYSLIQIMHLKDKLILDKVIFDIITQEWKYVAQICCFLLEEAQSRPLRRLGVKKDLFMGFYMTKEKK